MSYAERFGSPVERNWGDLRESRVGIMLHYDASSSDNGALTWLFKDKACAVSYNWLSMDNGELVAHVPADKRAWHAGICKPSNPSLPYADANSAFYGIAATANEKEKATGPQLESIISLCVVLFKEYGWKETHRIVGHNTEAWPRGRKDDPDGKYGKVLVVSEVRAKVAARL